MWVRATRISKQGRCELFVDLASQEQTAESGGPVDAAADYLIPGLCLLGKGAGGPSLVNLLSVAIAKLARAVATGASGYSRWARLALYPIGLWFETLT